MKKSLLLAIIAVFLLAGVSHADNFILNSSGYENGSNVSVVIPPNTASTETFAAYFKMNLGGIDYMGYCVDYAAIGWDNPYYDFSMIPIPDQARYREAAYLFEKYGQSAPSWGKEVQLAIWEVVFDQDDKNHSVSPNSGLFYVIDPGSAKLGTVQGYVDDAIANGGTFDASNYRLLVSPNTSDFYGEGNQDFIVKTPEPGMLALLGIGLLGLFLAARRKVIS